MVEAPELKDKLDATTAVVVNGPADGGDLKKVRNLQKLMLRSRANTLLSRLHPVWHTPSAVAASTRNYETPTNHQGLLEPDALKGGRPVLRRAWTKQMRPGLSDKRSSPVGSGESARIRRFRDIADRRCPLMPLHERSSCALERAKRPDFSAWPWRHKNRLTA